MAVHGKYPFQSEIYGPEPAVERNPFISAEADRSFPKDFHESRNMLPEPFWDGHESALDCYWKTWELAFRNLKRVSYGNGFVAPYIDTAFNDCLFMWDSAFIMMFCRYGARAFDFQRTLDNFYARQHPDGFMSREIQEWDGRDRWHRHDTVSTGPNVLPWCEWEYYLNFADEGRLAKVFWPLAAYHRWTRRYRSWPDGTYWSTGYGCGMDNQPRVPQGYDPILDHGHMSWIDATAQAALSARMLTMMAERLGSAGQVRDIEEEHETLAAHINDKMWDDAAGFYGDRFADGRVSGVKTVGAYWTLLAGVVPGERTGRFTAHLDDKRSFNRRHRVPSLAADHPQYAADGAYWRGAVWPPTNYMILRGLTAAGLDDKAAEIGRNHHDNVVAVFEKTGTVWENYAPESAAKGEPARSDFVGWGGLGPIAVLFEYILGLRPDVPHGRLVWDVRLTEAHGVKRYPFGPGGLMDLSAAARVSEAQEPAVTVRSDAPVEMEIRWRGGSKIFKIAAAR